MRTRKLARRGGHKRLTNMQVKKILTLPKEEKDRYIKALKGDPNYKLLEKK